MSETEQDVFDVVVIGAGPAGEVLADRAHRGGLSVAVVERRLVGGECSFYACIPSKALLRPVDAAVAAERVRGVDGPVRLNAEEVFARRDYWNSSLDDTGAAGWITDAGMTLVRGGARLTGPREVTVDDRLIRARQAVVLATGSAAAIPDIPGLRDARPWTNVEATTTHEVPSSLVVLGGGVVACELAQFFAALGSQVTILERAPRLLGRTEEFAATQVADQLRRDGIDIRLGAQVTAVSRGEDGRVTVSVSTADGDTEVIADQVLCALGRVPATGDLGLEAVGVAANPHGYLDVEADLSVPVTPGETPWLYGVGDVNGQALLTHMGKYQARACGDLIVARAHGTSTDNTGHEPPPLSPHRSGATQLGAPQVVFTDPQVAAVGLTTEQATERGLRTRVVDVPMSSAAGSGLHADEYQGTARLVIDEDRRVVVGATFVGQDVAELVHGATIAVIGEVPLDRLWHAVPSFPTMSEVWLRLLEAYGL